MIGWRSDIEFQKDTVFRVCRQIALRLELIYSIESVVAPALSNFKFGLVLPSYLLVATSVRYHLNSVLILLWLCRLHQRRTLIHLEED